MKKCDHCKTEFEAFPANKRFCSTKCKHRFYRANGKSKCKKFTECQRCGKELSGNQRKYCSKKCMKYKYADKMKIGGKLYEKAKEYRKDYRLENQEELSKKRKAKYYEDHEKTKEYNKEMRQRHKATRTKDQAARRAKKLKATPSWLTDEHRADIAILYKVREFLSNYDNVEYHVDHIIPLRGDGVSGLHVPWNLRIITAKENLEKNNKY